MFCAFLGTDDQVFLCFLMIMFMAVNCLAAMYHLTHYHLNDICYSLNYLRFQHTSWVTFNFTFGNRFAVGGLPALIVITQMPVMSAILQQPSRNCDVKGSI